MPRTGVSLAIYSGQAGEQFAYGLERFLEEARALARFDQHPGIVTVKSFFRAHGTGYCAMDYVEGLTLKANTGNPHTNGVGCAEPCEAQPTVGASCASYRQHNLRAWKFAEIS
ncbi:MULTISPECIES: hypothetical protein [unclassified Thiocapsa]|uniref:hypothetical protein n=1 Tax=unclassified Thiocapsa TaxID=2641286 RepID=UPI0035B1ED93